MANSRTAAHRALTLGTVTVLVAAGALAQVDRPPDRHRLPRGQGWWCYPETMATGQNGYRCERRRDGCAHSGSAAAAACVRERVAQCITFEGRDFSTGRGTGGFLCMRTLAECEAARSRVFSEGDRRVVSSCTDTR
jgi:hypothetical protein